MSIQIRRSEERGLANHGWLQSKHTFSFADYYDPHFLGFRSLCVINQDIVAPHRGFGTHPHNNMEIFSYVVSGKLQHQDSMGNSKVLMPGEIQLMSAGSGITHSEFNPSDEPSHFLQIWIKPNQKNLTPSYTEWRTDQSLDTKKLVISPDGRSQSAIIHQDAFIYLVQLSVDEHLTHEVQQGRGFWLQIIKGSLIIGDVILHEGDGCFTETAQLLTIQAQKPVEALLFDLA